MRNFFLFLTVFLFVPIFSVLAEANSEILEAGKNFSDSFVKGFFSSIPLILKMFFPIIIFLFFLKIGLLYLEKRFKKKKGGK